MTDQTDLRTPPKLGGVVPFSSCDYPGHLACVVFISGCPWRCHYCHNPHLQERHKQPTSPTWNDTLAWLHSRRGLLDAVVFCGGEPLAEHWLPHMMTQVRQLGFQVALHTGGAYPARLRQCLPLLDWVGFDVKAPFASYESVTQVRNSGRAARESLHLLIESGVPFECRTTVHPALHDTASLLQLAGTLAVQGVENFVLQPFRASGCASPMLLQKAIPPDWPDAVTLTRLRSVLPHTSIRTH
ncbi:anaerobic ribonucleoside-triphosphate reductase activating protein [Silvimonas amylolytica]|uniref:Anaerobic ribonucleoside-triphosphate reductase activating protein n=1 Tax=Silvimonas amylolytica TaxID=449663 RepID=A0ABQ2PJJ7_9NEIS|nr:anaerobic ribonucleoside-triphosphate reductase activating protein [Silvimonas amylolytica]GGP25526.1 anaerobic ribonucleoside-triphosphate reductase activating protein [Silvimonas amylolytica]